MTQRLPTLFLFFFFNDTATTEIYTLSLHDALPIWAARRRERLSRDRRAPHAGHDGRRQPGGVGSRSEEHTSELQSQSNLVCRLLLEKKKTNNNHSTQHDLDHPARLKRTRHMFHAVR